MDNPEDQDELNRRFASPVNRSFARLRRSGAMPVAIRPGRRKERSRGKRRSPLAGGRGAGAAVIHPARPARPLLNKHERVVNIRQLECPTDQRHDERRVQADRLLMFQVSSLWRRKCSTTGCVCEMST